jgi:hypothetical protein
MRNTASDDVMYKIFGNDVTDEVPTTVPVN